MFLYIKCFFISVFLFFIQSTNVLSQDTTIIFTQKETTELAVNLSYPFTNNGMSINLQSIDRGIDYLLDNRIPWMKKRNGKQKFLKVAARMARYAALDRPISFNVMLTNHEVLGHVTSAINNNYRLKGYYQPFWYYRFPLYRFAINVESPESVTNGIKGFISWEFKEGFNYSQSQKITLYASGVMAENVYRNQVQESWQKTGSISYADATTYIETMRDNFKYIRNAGIGFSDDMEYYFSAVNLNYFSDTVSYSNLTDFANENFQIKLKDFHRSNIISTLSDPNAYFSLYAIGNYLFTGRSATKLPFLKVGQVQFMPTLSMVLSPFGLEYSVRSPLITPKYNMRFHVRYGQAYHNEYYGFGLQLVNHKISKNVIIEPQIEFFAQPTFYYGNAKTETELYRKIGGNGFLTSVRFQKRFEGKTPYFVDCRLGYKTAGFVLGEGLTSYPIVQAGIGVDLNRSKRKKS